MATPTKHTPPTAPKPKPKPRPSPRPGEGDHSVPDDAPVPRPRMATVASPAPKGDGSAQFRGRVGTNPTASKSPPVKSDAATGQDNDTPWGKRLRSTVPIANKKPPLSPLQTSDKGETGRGTHVQNDSVVHKADSVAPPGSPGPLSPKRQAPPPPNPTHKYTPTPPPVSPAHSTSPTGSTPKISPTPPPPYASTRRTPSTSSDDQPKKEIDTGGNVKDKLRRFQKAEDLSPKLPLSKSASFEHTKTLDPPSQGRIRAPSTSEKEPKRRLPDPPTGPSAEQVAADMEFFSIELQKVGMSGGVGVVIKVDKVETGPQVKQTVLGPFIDEVLPQGAVDKDGRIQQGDLVAEVNGRSLLNVSTQEAARAINQSTGKTVRLKIGRSMSATLKAPQAVTQDLTTLKEMSVSRVEQLMMENASLREERDQTSKELEDYKIKMQGELEEREKVTSISLNKAAEVQAELNEELDTLKSQLKNILNERDHQHAMLQTLQEKSSEVTVLSSQLTELKSELEQQKQHSKELQTKVDTMTTISKETEGVESAENRSQKHDALLQEKDLRITDLTRGLTEALPKLQEAEQLIAVLKETVQEKDTLISQLEGTAGGQDTADHKGAQSTEEDEAINEQDEAVKERDEAINEQDEAIKERDEVIKDRDEAIKERDEAIKERDEAIKERDEAIKERDEAIKERDETIKEREDTMKERDEAIRERNDAIKERDDAIRERDDAIKERDEVVTKKPIESQDVNNVEKESLPAEVKESTDKSELESLQEEIETLKDQLQSVSEHAKVAERENSELKAELKANLSQSGKVSPVPRPRSAQRKHEPAGPNEIEESDTPTAVGREESPKVPPKPIPRPRQKPPKVEVTVSGTQLDFLETSVESQEKDLEEANGGEEEQEEQEEEINFEDFEAISRRTETFSTHFEKAKLSANRNRMRRVPSREHLQMKSSGKVGHELVPVKLEVVEEERSHLSFEPKHGRKHSHGLIGPPAVLPKPKEGLLRAKSAEDLLDGEGNGSIGRRVPLNLGPRVMPPIPTKPMKKSQSGDHIKEDKVTEVTDGSISGGSTPSRSRPASSKDTNVHGSSDSLDMRRSDHMDSTGLPLSQIPEWSSDQVAKWFESVHLETYANSVREKNLTGKQLIDLDTGKLKALALSKDDMTVLKKEVKSLKKEYEKARKEEKKRLENERKELKKKKK